MSKYFTETGSLTTEGERLLSDVKHALSDLIESDPVYRMDQMELRVLGSHLAKMAATGVSDRITRQAQLIGKYQAMTDEEFMAHIHSKYGILWTIVSLEKEELQRMPQSVLEAAAQDRNFICESLYEYMISRKMKVE